MATMEARGSLAGPIRGFGAQANGEEEGTSILASNFFGEMRSESASITLALLASSATDRRGPIA